MTRHARTIASPVGDLTLVAEGDALTMLVWSRVAGAADGADHPVLDEAERQLAGYFAGTRRAFDLPLAPDGTDFQRAVWTALLAIPYGETRSYAEVARAIGRPSAVRAVGAANGRNPLSIVTPCHRVIGADSSLTGFGGGLPAKRFLLALEARGSLL